MFVKPQRMKSKGIIAAVIVLIILCNVYSAFARDIVDVPGVQRPSFTAPVSGISDDTHSNYLSLNNFHTSWQYWCQGASAVGPTYREGACFMVAQSKLLVESGIESSDKSVFNPDIYYSRTCKLNEGDIRDFLVLDYKNESGQTVNGYVRSHGGTISKGVVSLTQNNQTDAATIMQYINNGYYCILHYDRGEDNRHFTYVWREKSLSMQTPVISDSSSNCSYSGNTCYTLTSDGTTYQELLYYRVSGGAYHTSGSEMTTGGTQVLPDGDYIIASAARGDKSKIDYIDIYGTAVPAASGDNVCMVRNSSYSSTIAADVWTLTYLNDGFYKITQKGTDMSLDVQGESQYSGANIMVHPYKGSSNEKWAISHNGSNGYRIQAKISGFSLDMSGDNIVQAAESGNASQAWFFIPWQPSQPVEEGKYVLLSDLDQSLMLHVPGGTSGNIADQTELKIWQDTAEVAPGNIFEFKKISGGYYRITHTRSGKAVEVFGAVSTVRAPIILYTPNGSHTQAWAVIPNGTGKYMLVEQSSGYAIDLLSGNTANGSAVGQWPRNKKNTQTWHLVPAEHTVHFDANNGSGAPDDQAKLYKTDLTLSTTVPTRTGYNFMVWGRTPDDFSPYIRPGESYTLDEDLTLYAIWEFNKPGLRVSCAVDGVPVGPEEIIGTFDVEVFSDGFHEKKSGIIRYNVDLIAGSTYTISNIHPVQGYAFDSATSGPLEGTIGDTVQHVVLNFVPIQMRGLEVKFLVDGEMRNTIEGIGSIDVSVSGDTVSVNETGVPSFSDLYEEDCLYEIGNISAELPYGYWGVSSGNLSGRLTADGGTQVVVLEFRTLFIPTDEWQEMDELPDNIDLGLCEVMYKHHYSVQARTSPGEEWTLSEEGPVQYENDGSPYLSDNPLSTSATRVQVGSYFFHWCGHPESPEYGNWCQVAGKYTKYHRIPPEAMSSYQVTDTYPDGDRNYHLLKNLDGQWAGGRTTCADGCPYYYDGYVYQNKKAYRVNTYTMDSNWTTEFDPDAASVRYRVRRQTPGLQITAEVDGNAFNSLQDIASFDLYLDGQLEQKDCTGFSGTLPADTVYTINNIRVIDEACLYTGLAEGTLSGTVGERKNRIVLSFVTQKSSDVSMVLGDTLDLSAKVQGNAAGAFYTSLRPGIVSVDLNGTATALKPGTAVVNVLLADGSKQALTVIVGSNITGMTVTIDGIRGDNAREVVVFDGDTDLLYQHTETYSNNYRPAFSVDWAYDCTEDQLVTPGAEVVSFRGKLTEVRPYAYIIVDGHEEVLCEGGTFHMINLKDGEQLVLPAGLRYIEHEAFLGAHVDYLMLPASVQSIGKNVTNSGYIFLRSNGMTLDPLAFPGNTVLVDLSGSYNAAFAAQCEANGWRYYYNGRISAP